MTTPNVPSPHTPRPWSTYGNDWRIVVDARQNVVADVRTHADDALLIAAAPDLLGAIEAALLAPISPPEDDDFYCYLPLTKREYDALVSARDKARGVA